MISSPGGDGRIFVQVAAYRDPELLPTINHALKQADRPDLLTFGICRQFHPLDRFGNLDSYKKDARFRILDWPVEKVEGVGWARRMTQRLYRGEEFTLQLDAHMRFARNWDAVMIKMLNDLRQQGYPKPLLTGYMGSYVPGGPFTPDPNDPPLQMNIHEVTPEGIPIFGSEIIPNWEKLRSPVPAKFFSGGFYFTTGGFNIEVPYDSAVYFQGEEITMAVRAFTSGYDLFHPHRMLLWHYYTRPGQQRPWNDDRQWIKKEQRSSSAVLETLRLAGLSFQSTP